MHYGALSGKGLMLMKLGRWETGVEHKYENENENENENRLIDCFRFAQSVLIRKYFHTFFKLL